MDISTGNAAISAIDTGTTAIGGPTDDVSAIWAAVPGASAVREQGGEGFFQFRGWPFLSWLENLLMISAVQLVRHQSV